MCLSSLFKKAVDATKCGQSSYENGSLVPIVLLLLLYSGKSSKFESRQTKTPHGALWKIAFNWSNVHLH